MNLWTLYVRVLISCVYVNAAKTRFVGSTGFTKTQDNYNTSTRSSASKFKPKSLYPSLSSSSNSSSTTALPIFTEDFFLSPSSINLLNFNLFNNESLSEFSDESYSNIKNLSNLYTQGYQSGNLLSFNFFTPVSYASVLNSFRADFDENL